MVLWVFGYGSLLWKPGFQYDHNSSASLKATAVSSIKGAPTIEEPPEYPGRTVAREPADCHGVAYRISGEEEQTAFTSLEEREKQYDNKAYLDFYTDLSSVNPAVSRVLVYIGSANKTTNKNYLGPASIEEMALQIYNAEGPSGPNKDYLFEL